MQFWLGMKGIQYESIVWVIMCVCVGGGWGGGGGVGGSQNTGLLIALVKFSLQYKNN